jgi:hypothetical protein
MDETQLDVISGDTFVYTWTFYNEDGTVLPLTTATGYFVIKEKEEDIDDDAILLKNYTSTAPTTGVMIYSATPAEMDIAEGQYYYAMRIKIGTDVYTFLYGNLIVKSGRMTIP